MRASRAVSCTRRCSVQRNRGLLESLSVMLGQPMCLRELPGADRWSRSRAAVWMCHGIPSYRNLLEFAEACDVRVKWSCRTGVCHTCECAIIDGSVDYDPEPLEPPAEGNVLICCARHEVALQLDL